MKEPVRDDQSNIKILKNEKSHSIIFSTVPDSLRENIKIENTDLLHT